MGGSAILQQRHRNKKKKEVWLAVGNSGVIDPHPPALPKHALKSSGIQKPDLVLLISQCQVT